MSVKRTTGPRRAAKSEAPEVQREFGQRLKEARIAADLTLAELAERTGTQRSYISEIEHGHRNATIETMSKLAAAIGRVSISYSRPLAKRNDSESSSKVLSRRTLCSLPSEHKTACSNQCSQVSFC